MEKLIIDAARAVLGCDRLAAAEAEVEVWEACQLQDVDVRDGAERLAELAEWRDKITELAEDYALIERVTAGVTEANAQLTQENTRLAHDNEMLKHQNCELLTRIDELNDELRELKQQSQDLWADNNRLRLRMDGGDV